MTQPVFATALDDIYQAPQWANALGGAGPLRASDLRVMVGLAVVFGESLVVPGRFVIDNLTLIDEVCESPKWRELVLKILRPAVFELTWDKFIATCGGTSKQPPVYMTSYRGQHNVDLRRTWNKGKGWHESQKLFKIRYPAAVAFVEALKESQVQPLQLKPTTKLYQARFSERVNSASSIPRDLAHRLKTCDSRSAALECLVRARESGEITDHMFSSLTRRHWYQA